MRRPFYWKARKGWYIRIEAADGRTRSLRLGKTRKEADAEWARMQTEAEQLQSVTELPVHELIGRFTEAMHREVELDQISAKTVERRLNYLVSFCQAIDDELAVTDLKPHHVTKWLSEQTRWNATTQYHALETLKGVFRWGTDQELIQRNPISKMKGKRGASRDFLVTQETFQALLHEVGANVGRRRGVTSFRTVLIALKLSGCRPGEVVSVRIEDWSGDTWTLVKHKTARKKRRPRVVFLPPCLQTLTRIAAHGRTSGPIFRPEPGRGWQYSDMRRRFERLRKRAELDPKFVMYSFRHTWITNAMVAGVDVATVAELAGTSIQMIERHYGHLGQRADHLRKAVLVAVG